MTQSGYLGISGSENYAAVCNSFYHCDRSDILLQPYLVAACALFGFASGMKRKCRLRRRFTMTEPVLSKLEQRLGGRVYARQRLKIETDREAQVFGQGLFNFFHIGNWYPIHSVIRILLKLTGLYWRGRRNTARLQVSTQRNPLQDAAARVRRFYAASHQRFSCRHE